MDVTSRAYWWVQNLGQRILKGKEMNLAEALNQVEDLDDDLVIFAKKPWSFHSDAIVGLLDDDFKPPKKITDLGFSYFLEIAVAKEVLGVFGDRGTTIEERSSLLMYYAENDAYPDWVYE
jgi:hypothetical protein